MKKIIKGLEGYLEKLRNYVEERNRIGESRSEKWQDSEARVIWEDKTRELDEMVDELDTYILNLMEL